MFRKIVVLLGLLASGEGVWLIVNERNQNAACNASLVGVRTSSFATSSRCVNIAWVYFGGFVLAIAGALIVGFGLVVLRRRFRKGPKRSSRPSLFQEWFETTKGAGEARLRNDGATGTRSDDDAHTKGTSSLE